MKLFLPVLVILFISCAGTQVMRAETDEKSALETVIVTKETQTELLKQLAALCQLVRSQKITIAELQAENTELRLQLKKFEEQ